MSAPSTALWQMAGMIFHVRATKLVTVQSDDGDAMKPPQTDLDGGPLTTLVRI